jgi:transposase InsO family protein
MPWRECTEVTERSEAVRWVVESGAEVATVARSFGVSRKTVYKWLERYQGEGLVGLEGRSRRPLRSPKQTASELEARIVGVRREHPAWGGRKIHHWLRERGVAAPAPSTITSVLKRHGLLNPDRRQERDWQRFEEAEPNVLWQMDYKGHFATAEGRCHPLTVLDDHSRFNICLEACSDERALTVQGRLRSAFERYGMPERMLMDNGSPWGSDGEHRHTRLTAWLIRLGISVSHGRPYHPQTQGKEERFHRTLSAEVLRARSHWESFAQVQEDFGRWRQVYNFERPHEALGNRPPASRYRPSHRLYPATLPELIYEPGDELRKVQDKGRISFRNRSFLVSRAFIGDYVGLRQSGPDTWDIYYGHQRVARLDLQTRLPSDL